MSAFFDHQASAPAYSAQQNRLDRRIEQYLNTLGNWNTYRAVTQPADILSTVIRVTAATFGLNSNHFSFTGVTVLGAMMALHALERVTAAAATLAVRLTSRTPALAWHRGIAVRASPLASPAGRALKWLLGSRLQQVNGCYFHHSGWTWHYQVLTLRVCGESRTLAYLRSISPPHRSHFFDRDISWPVAIEVALGERLPERLVGHIGSINELEHAAGLPARAKLAFIAANWLLVDAEERTAAGIVTPGGWSPPDQARYATKGGTLPTPAGPAAPRVQPRSRPGWPLPGAPPGDRINDRYRRYGRSYPLLVRNIVVHPITLRRKADAIYYDDAARCWREVTDEQDRLALAEDVAAGRLRITPNWRDYL